MNSDKINKTCNLALFDTIQNDQKTGRILFEIKILNWNLKALKVGNETKSWQKYIGSPSPMPIEIGAATFITAVILSGSSFFK